MPRREQQPAIEGNGTLRRNGYVIGTAKYVLTPFKVYMTVSDETHREPEEVLIHEEIEGTMEVTDDDIDIMSDGSLTLEMSDGGERAIYVTVGYPSTRTYAFVFE